MSLSSRLLGKTMLACSLLLVGAVPCWAAPASHLAVPLSVLSVSFAAAPLGATANGGGSGQISGLGGASAPWTIVVLLTFLSLIPSLLLCVTPFARLLIVFHFCGRPSVCRRRRRTRRSSACP